MSESCTCSSEPCRARSRKEIADLLQGAAHAQYPVRVERDHEWGGDLVYGYVVSVSKDWVAIQELADGVYVNGYEVLRIGDVTNVEDDRESGYVERAVAILGRPKVDFRLPKRAATREVLRAAADHSALISVHFEREDDGSMLVGSITRLAERKFEIMMINPAGVWVAEPSREWYKDVTRVKFGDRYSSQLARFGEERPA